MKMKIKVKVKHLVLTLLALGALILLTDNVLLPQWRHLAAGGQPAEGTDGIGSKAELLEALAHPKNDKQKWLLIRDYIIENGAESIVRDVDLTVGPGFTQSGGGVTGEHSLKDPLSWAERLPYLEQYVEGGPVDGYYVRAAKQVAFYYGNYGQPDKAIEQLELANKRINDAPSHDNYYVKEIWLAQAKLLAEQDDKAAALETLDRLTKAYAASDTHLNGEIVRIRAQLLMSEGNLKEALAQVKRQVKEEKQFWEEVTKDFLGKEAPLSLMAEQLTMLRDELERVLKQGGEVSEVSGTVKRSDGTPMPGVAVFLRQREAVNHSVLEGEPYQTVTGADGSFSFRGVLEGSYQIFLGFKYDQIDGYTWPVEPDTWIDVKGGAASAEQLIVLTPLIELMSPVNQQNVTGSDIEFRWEEIEGAAYYNLEGAIPIKNGSVHPTIRTHVKGNQIRIPLEELYETVAGISFGETGDWRSVSPEPLLGFADTENRFSWGVQAFDANGRLLTRSGGYRLREETVGNLPFFYIKERTMTKADHLLRKGKMDEAFDAYKEDYEQDAGDVHSLQMMIRMLEAKVSVMDEKRYEDEALTYLQKLGELRPSAAVLSRLAGYYYEREDWPAYHEAIAEYLRVSPVPLNEYEQSVYATALMRQGKLEEALGRYKQALQKDISHRFVGNYVAILIYSNKTLLPAIEAAEQYPERSYGPEKNDWSELLRNMQEEGEQFKDPQAANKPVAGQAGRIGEGLAGQKAGNGDGWEAYRMELNRQLDLYFQGEEEKLETWLSEAAGTPAMKNFIRALLTVG
ncbi:carboxypeptidase regulatory-like domain-containing protein [Paenibacillus spongiae]|uniref:Carboxypeptidase regulatory-like domain-containing protein n=1 Tax=Paenibacillus spongiae TaxID=2909671 RepID=A0ABY5S6P4_9BACL|nr:carboxypeptidase regulatory-like domain-containing protein [Paenibacillus spongiae]UVI29591.1 carboxypeptidase regulatory-like domain-containing protein [Paenibacillus spongiae]